MNVRADRFISTAIISIFLIVTFTSDDRSASVYCLTTEETALFPDLTGVVQKLKEAVSQVRNIKNNVVPDFEKHLDEELEAKIGAPSPKKS